MEFDIENDIKIDQFNLPKECISLADTYRFYAEKASEAESIVSKKNDYLKVVLAERNIAIREQCSKEGKKVTEGMISSMVDKDTDVVNARTELRDAEATYKRLSVAVAAMQIKKSQVDNLVKLYCNSMYVDSKPQMTRNVESNATDDYNHRTMNQLPN